MLHSLDHVVLAVRSLEAATLATERLLGRPAAWRGEHPGAGTANTLFQLGNTYLELLAPTGAEGLGARVEAFLSESGEGLLALAFGTDDAGACAVALRERGLGASDPLDGAGRDAATDAERSWTNVFLDPGATRGIQLFAIEHRAGTLPDPAPTADPYAAVAALDHVVVTSPDPEASRALYGDALGLRLALDRSFEARGVRILFFRVGGVTVEVAGPLVAPADAGASDRFGGLAWQVPDADLARERLEKEGFDVSGVRDGHKPGTRVCTVRDAPASVPTLIIEPAARLPHEPGRR